MSENPYQPYGQTPPPYGYGYGYAPPRDHPQATTVLVLGILGLLLCQVLAPFAWIMGGRVLREIDAAGGAIGGRGSVNAGRICGIIGTVMLALSIAVSLLVVVLVVASS